MGKRKKKIRTITIPTFLNYLKEKVLQIKTFTQILCHPSTAEVQGDYKILKKEEMFYSQSSILQGKKK